jgi:hypothetical protein
MSAGGVDVDKLVMVCEGAAKDGAAADNSE